MSAFFRLLRRDVENCINKRMFLLLGFMALFQSWFIISSNSVKKVAEAGHMEYMAVVFSFNFFGALVALALTFDSISRERRNKVMDLILTAGIQKRTVIWSKTSASLAISFLFSLLYTVAIAAIYLALGSGVGTALQCLTYVPAITAFNFIYCMLGLMLSIIFRSSRTSFILGMVIGMLCMPRLFASMVDGIAGALKLGQNFTDLAYMASPAFVMNALIGGAGSNATAGIGFIAFYAIMMISLSLVVFQKQDELNYGE